MRLGKALWVLALLALLLLPAGQAQSPRQEHTCAEGGQTTLYLAGSDALATAPGAEGSAAFQARAGGPLVWLVGTWDSPPLGVAMRYSGNINFTLWAKGSNAFQLNTRFQVYFGTNGQRGATAYNSNSARLGTAPREFKGTATNVLLDANAGDTITFMVYVSERGTGGELVYGGSYPSRIELPIQPVSINLTLDSQPGELRMSASVSDIWGSQDLSKLTLAVLGPYSKEDQTLCGRDELEKNKQVVLSASDAQLEIEDTDNQTLFSYTWKYDATKIAAGPYLAVAVVETYSNSTGDASGWVSLQQRPGRGLFENPAVLVGIPVLAALAIVGAAAFYYRRQGKSLRHLLTDRKAVMAVGVAVLLVAVATAGLYLTLGPSKNIEKAPGFNLQDVNGRNFALEDFRGKVVVLDLMATWCPTCNQEIPELRDFHGKNPDVVIISIDVDRTETSQQLKSHMESNGASWIFARDTDNVMGKYHATEIPRIAVITPGGYLTFIKSGLVRSDELGKVAATAKSGSPPILSLGGEMAFWAIAFIAGISAFFSPCAFPLLPGYMTYYLGREAGVEEESANGLGRRSRAVRKAVLGGIAAAVGVLLVYLLMGLVVAAGGQAVKPYAAYMLPIVAVVIIIMGIVMLTNYVLPVYRITGLFTPVVNSAKKGLARLTRRPGAEPGQYVGLVGYGAGYGAASLGCHAPIFIGVVMLGLAAGGVAAALVAFLMYGLGMGLFLVITTVLVGMAKTQLVKRMQAWMPMIKKVSGLVMIVVGAVLIYMFFFPLPQTL